MEVDFYLDYSCPWSYLGFSRLTETAIRTGATIVFKPIVVNRVLEQTSPSLAHDRSEPHPAKARYQTKDLNDWAEFCGITLKRPPNWPADSELAARGGLVACDNNRGGIYAREVFRAYFHAGENIAEIATLREAAEKAELDADRFDRALTDDRLLKRLLANCRELLDRGGFGSPTMFVSGAMFFGNDRMPLVEFALGQASGRRLVAPGDHGA